jgi:LemA protein
LISLSATLVTAVLACVLVFWALGAYNRLIRLRTQVARSLAALCVAWQTQAQAIAVRLEQYAQGRDTISQWASLDEDALRWRPLSLSAHQFLACLSVLQAKPQHIGALDDLSAVRAARDIFEANWQRLAGEQEDLAGTPVPPDLQLLMAQHEPLASERLRDYNQAVQAYSQAISQFPAVLLAWVFGFNATGELG